MNLTKSRERIIKLNHQIELIQQAIETISRDVATVGSPFPNGMPVHRSGSDPTANRAAILSERLGRLRTELHQAESERSEILHHVKESCWMLSERETQCVLLRVKGYSFRQIASRLNCTVRHAQRIFLNTQKKLRKGGKSN